MNINTALPGKLSRKNSSCRGLQKIGGAVNGPFLRKNWERNRTAKKAGGLTGTKSVSAVRMNRYLAEASCGAQIT
jgi:hypothetical protein